jgi:hypothetical protein
MAENFDRFRHVDPADDIPVDYDELEEIQCVVPSPTDRNTQIFSRRYEDFTTIGYSLLRPSSLPL